MNLGTRRRLSARLRLFLSDGTGVAQVQGLVWSEMDAAADGWLWENDFVSGASSPAAGGKVKTPGAALVNGTTLLDGHHRVKFEGIWKA